jgi:hypothetical protein
MHGKNCSNGSRKIMRLKKIENRAAFGVFE